MPTPDPLSSPPSSPASPTSPPGLDRRRSSLSETFRNARLPPGALAATGEAFGRAPSLAELRRSSTASAKARRGSSMSIPGVGSPPVVEESSSNDGSKTKEEKVERKATEDEEEEGEDVGKGAHAWGVVVEGLRAFWRYFLTPLGFCVTIYMLNVIAWGGMLFLLLIPGGAPAMCHPSCDDINSPRRIWIEIDSQILNALFCVTGFGLVPWRFRDLYYLLKWRVFGKKSAYLHLLELKKEWFRPAWEDSEEGAQTQTGAVRAPPTKSWKLDYVIWLYVWNTFFQCALSGFMWGMNRVERPSWSTGLFVALAFIVAGMAGGQVWWETKQVKKIEEGK